MSSDEIDLSQFVEGRDGISVIRTKQVAGGDNLDRSVDNEAGDFIFIEPGVPHEVYNLSDSEPVVAVVARSDSSEWQNITPYPSAARTRDGVVG